MKREFFKEILKKTHKSRIWDLVEWTKPRKQGGNIVLTDAEGKPASEPKKVAELLQKQFTSNNKKPVNYDVVNKMEQQEKRKFQPMSQIELMEALQSTENFSAPGPDNVSWFWLKQIVRDESGPKYSREDTSDKLNTEHVIITYYNACMKYRVQPKIFKVSKTVVIAKPNRPDYTKAKAYRSIVLLNCLGKLMEKIIAQRLQVEGQKYGIMHPCQFGGTIQHSTQDAGIQLVHNVKQLWKQGIDSSAILMDVHL